jgi:hypothetical protein
MGNEWNQISYLALSGCSGAIETGEMSSGLSLTYEDNSSMENFFVSFVLPPTYEKKLAETKGLLLLAGDLFYLLLVHTHTSGVKSRNTANLAM